MWKKMFIKTARGKFELFVAGKGEPLCITHHYSAFNELGYYFADPFTKDFKVHLINLKDAGNSDPAQNKSELSMEETIKDLEAIRLALGYNDWMFAGHSTGGMLGLTYGITHPESLKKLMIGGAAASNEYMTHPDSMYNPENKLNKRTLEIMDILNDQNKSNEEKIAANREWTGMSLYDPSKMDDYFAKPSSGSVVQSRLDYFSFEELPDYDIRHLLEKITTPTFVFGGKHDVQCPYEYTEEISALIPGAKLYTFEASNHVPYLEEEAAFNQMVQDFLHL